mgnify:CR=1 FL=1
MMNFLVAFMTNHQCFSAFCKHYHFPRLFSFQIFDLVHMVYFVFSVFSFITAKFTTICFQSAVYRCSALSNDSNDCRNNIFAFLTINFIEFGKFTNLFSGFCFIGNPPPFCTSTVFVINFRQLALVLPSKGFQTAVFH